MAHTADNPLLRIGVEIEGIFNPRYRVPNELRVAFVERLVAGCPDMYSAFRDGPKFKGEKWVIEYDPSLRGVDYNPYGPFVFEVVSPILNVSPSGTWRDEIIDKFHYLEGMCTITTNKTCGFHVHLSPGNGEEWEVDEPRNISFAILYFEGAILALLPGERQKSTHLLSNYHHSQLAGLTIQQYPECPYAWNFGNLTKRPNTTGMTIEWRQPPGVTTAKQCLAWTELAVRFVRAARDWKDMVAVGTGVGLEMRYSRDVDGLKRFLQERGGYSLSGTDEGHLEDIFRGRSGSEPVVDYDHRVDHPEQWDIEHPRELIPNEL